MSFLEKIHDANQGLVSTNSEVYLISKPKPSDNLKTILNWVKVEGERLSKDLQNFKDHVEFLLSENVEFYKWVVSNTQQNISAECGISQAYASRIFGPIQKEYKEKVKDEIVKKVQSGESYKEIATAYGCSEKSIQRAIKDYDRTNYNSDNLSTEVDSVLEQRRKSILSGRGSRDLADIIINQEDKIKELQATIEKHLRKIKRLEKKRVSE